MHGQQNTAILHPAFISLGFVLRNSESDQRPHEAADSTANAETCERAHDGAGSDERTHARNRQRADTGEQSECSAHCTAYAHACGRALRRLGVLFCGEIF